jgi:very-short-patch-repair endonuclease
VVSHDSAAAMHGLPLLHSIERPTLSVVDDDHRVATTGATIRCAGMRPEEITDWFGAPVLTVERTVADIARSTGVAAGLVAADAALHDGLTTLELLVQARGWSRYRPGVKAFDRVLELADGRAESPLETLVRLCLVDGGLPAPEPQVWVETHRGRYRVDMAYPAQRVIIEADGALKYDGREPMALVDEKRRQEALERADYVVVRVTWWEVRNEPWEVVARVRRKLAAASR